MIQKKGTINIFSVALLYFMFAVFNSCSSTDSKKMIDEHKKNLLTIEKNWSDRTESEKAIGCWAAKPERIDGTGNSSRIKGDLNYMLIFYADGTLDDLTFYTIGFSKTDPLISHYTDYYINGGYITYKYNGKEISRRIDIQSDQIKSFGRTYNRTACAE